MAKNKYYVDFSITLMTGRVIAADSDEEALRIAEELRFDTDFYTGLVDSWENDYDAWRGKYCEVDVWCKAPDTEPADNEEE